MFKYTLCKEQSMNLGISILVIAFAIASIGLAPSLMISQSASAVSHWCENQGKSSAWVEGCKNGWSDHDKCYSYDHELNGDMAKGYKVGWSKGSCH
jgi:hypothetical protein